MTHTIAEKTFHSVFADIDRALNTSMDQIGQVLVTLPLPEELPTDPDQLADLPAGIHELVSLYCFCNLAGRDLGDGGLVDMRDTYEEFRKEIHPKLKETYGTADSDPTITLAMSHQDGAQAAARMFAAGYLLPEHATNEGADNWGEPGCNLGDAATVAYQDSRFAQVSDFKDLDHWQAFLEAFEEMGRMCLVEKKPFDF